MTAQSPDNIQLDQFLKVNGVVASGGEAKQLIQNGNVIVNREVELRRGRKLKAGDVIEVGGRKLTVK
jgi:ribosome-associated protein